MGNIGETLDWSNCWCYHCFIVKRVRKESKERVGERNNKKGEEWKSEEVKGDSGERRKGKGRKERNMKGIEKKEDKVK